MHRDERVCGRLRREEEEVWEVELVSGERSGGVFSASPSLHVADAGQSSPAGLVKLSQTQ